MAERKQDHPSINTSTAQQTLVLANSPNFIFNHLQKDAAVKAIVVRCSADEILEWLKEHLPLSVESVEELAQRYIYLIALSFKEPGQYLSALTELPTERLEWGNELKAMIRYRATTTTQVNVVAAPRITTPSRGLPQAAPGWPYAPAEAKDIRIIIPSGV